MTTIHAYTNDQKILDQIHPDMRRARAAGMSMIPTTTGAARAVGEVLPELKGKLDGSAIRVPTPNVSLVDLTFTPEPRHQLEEVNAALKAASESGPLKGILDYTDEPLVSIDYNHNPASSTVDSLETAVIEGKLVRVLPGTTMNGASRTAWSTPRAAMAQADLSAMASFKTLDDLGDVAGKRALVRVDLNVPMQDGAVTRRHAAARRRCRPSPSWRTRARSSSCSPISAGPRGSGGRTCRSALVARRL